MAGSCCSSSNTTEEGKKETNIVSFCPKEDSALCGNCPIWAKGDKPIQRDSQKVGH